ncbi:MAG: MFS transporter, partial [Bryobacteraceae bacterium]
MGALDEFAWRKALRFCDRAQLTLPLGLTCRDSLPPSIRARIDGNLASNAERWVRIGAAYRSLAVLFEAEGLEFAVLKGFSQCPNFVADPRHRAQYDIDLLLPRQQAPRARDAALCLGYEPVGGFDRLPIDHLPTMIRKTGWEWRGDHFDPEIPPSLELHFRLWDAETEGFAPAGLDQFWERREQRRLEDVGFTALHPADAVAYSSLHLLRHSLRGDLRISHVYELAWLLDRRADDDSFWNVWRDLHGESLRALEAICFELAHQWFECRLPPAAVEQIERLSPDVRRWLDTYSASPLIGLFHPNKNEIWLHWSLLDSRRARVKVLLRRVLPQALPGAVDGVHLPREKLTLRIRLRSRWRYVVYFVSRVVHHARTLPQLGWSAMHWFGAGTGLAAPYWRFLVAAGLFDFGLFIYFLLYNLYLLQLGFDERFLGLVAGAMTAGGAAGSLPAAFVMQRFGIRKTLLVCFALIASLSALRACVVDPSLLLVLAFVGGAISATWAVAISPAIAQLTSERARPLGFSLVFSSGISIGILGGIAGGHLPALLSAVHLASSRVQSFRAALLLSCGIVLLALWPLSGVALGPAARP